MRTSLPNLIAGHSPFAKAVREGRACWAVTSVEGKITLVVTARHALSAPSGNMVMVIAMKPADAKDLRDALERVGGEEV
jgi:hypothetical protein